MNRAVQFLRCLEQDYRVTSSLASTKRLYYFCIFNRTTSFSVFSPVLYATSLSSQQVGVAAGSIGPLQTNPCTPALLKLRSIQGLQDRHIAIAIELAAFQESPERVNVHANCDVEPPSSLKVGIFGLFIRRIEHRIRTANVLRHTSIEASR